MKEAMFTVSDFEKGSIVIKFKGNLIHLTNVLNFVGIDWVDYFELLSDSKNLVGKFLYGIRNVHNRLELRITDSIPNEKVIVVNEEDIFVVKNQHLRYTPSEPEKVYSLIYEVFNKMQYHINEKYSYEKTVCECIDNRLANVVRSPEDLDLHLSKELYDELCEAFGGNVKKYKGHKIIVK